jgi:uncharacterized protein (DUF305 family)
MIDPSQAIRNSDEQSLHAPYRVQLLLVLVLSLSVASLAAAQVTKPTSGGAPSMAVQTTATEAPFIAENDTSMDKMSAGMTIKPTGDIDRDFVAMMVPHHQGAIDMAEAELRFGHNELLLRICQEIIAEQLQEIAAMRLAAGEPVSAYQAMLAATPTRSPKRQDARWSSSMPTGRDSPGSEKRFLSENNSAMNKMMTNMSVKATGNIDRDFVAMMIPHHQGAIDMARAELRYGHSEQLRPVVQEIIVDQMNEIVMMRLALGETLPPSTASPTGVSQTWDSSIIAVPKMSQPMQMPRHPINMK